MTETVRYSQLGVEDIRFGTGTFKVTLADGSVVTLNEVNVNTQLNALTTGKLAFIENDWHTTRYFNTFATAISSIGATQGTLIIPRSYAVSATVSVPSTLDLFLMGQGELPVSSDVTLTTAGAVFVRTNATAFTGSGTLTINGSFEAPRRQVFGDNLTVTFGRGAVTAYLPEWQNSIQKAVDWFYAAPSAPVRLLAESYDVTATIEYDTTGDGAYPGLWMQGGAGQRHTTLVNKITAGGPTISLTSGASSADFQYGGRLGGFKLTESGSGADSHGVQYRGTWHQVFEDIHADTLNGKAFSVVNSEGDDDASAHVEFYRVSAVNGEGPGWSSDGASGGVTHHSFYSPRFHSNKVAQMHIEAVVHLAVYQGSLTGQGAGAPAVPAVWLATGTTGNAGVTLMGGEYGNNSGTFIKIDRLSGGYIGGMRFVRRTSEANSSIGIDIVDGTSLVQGLTIGRIYLEIDDATPAWTFINFGSSVGQDGVTVESPRQTSFASGNTLYAFGLGSISRVTIHEEGAERIPMPYRYESVDADSSPFAPNADLAPFQRIRMTVSPMEISAPTAEGDKEGRVLELIVFNASGGTFTPTLASGADGFRADAVPSLANAEVATTRFRWDPNLARWVQIGGWSGAL